MKKFAGFLLGSFFSLGGVVVWIILETFTGFIASASAYLMVALFFAGYNLVVGEQKKSGAFALAALVVIFNIVVINVVYLVLDAAYYEISIAELLADSEYLGNTILYAILPLVFGAMGIAGYYSKFKRDCAAQDDSRQ
jgi:hypothetical protein